MFPQEQAPAGRDGSLGEEMGMAPADWQGILAATQHGGEVCEPWRALFGPFAAVGQSLVIGQFGQSLDGRIATPTGESKYINGRGGLAHLHRVRALVDAVVVGVSTAIADDPRLDVRFVEGPSPARVVIDPRGRLPHAVRLLRDDGIRRVVVTAAACATRYPDGVEVIRLEEGDDGLAPADVVRSLAEAGLPRILVEGGSRTVSRFLSAGALDRLHVIVAPFLIGDGPTGISLPGVRSLSDGIRPPTRAYPLGEDVLFDCDLAAARRAAARGCDPAGFGR